MPSKYRNDDGRRPRTTRGGQCQLTNRLWARDQSRLHAGTRAIRRTPFPDSLIAKVIGYSPTSNFEDAVRRARRALSEFRAEGVPTNITYLLALLERPEVLSNQVTTRFISNFASELAEAAKHISLKSTPEARAAEAATSLAGAKEQ